MVLQYHFPLSSWALTPRRSYSSFVHAKLARLLGASSVAVAVDLKAWTFEPRGCGDCPEMAIWGNHGSLQRGHPLVAVGNLLKQSGFGII